MSIKGITIKLYEEIQVGTDAFNRPYYNEVVSDVDNVLVAPATETEILESVNLTGRKAIFTLGIPKGDMHNWTDKKVSFFGRTFKTIGAPLEGIPEMIPLKWNKKIRVEEING